MRLRRVFIANRGEIAVRIIRSCRALGIETVIGVSSADRDGLPARLADRAVCIGAAPSGESYLRADTLVHAALATQCDALHPGYGFLSERSVLARLCEQAQIAFIGPTAAQIEAVGDKLRARAAAAAAAVPVAPGGEVNSARDACSIAQQLGMPLLVKAVGGGGGRGMKRVERMDELASAVEMAAAEAGAAFGDARVYLERFVTRGRHIEVQVLGDGAGNVIHLGERDCSVQRRYQKLIEETPAPGLSAQLRQALHEAAVRFAARLDYRGAGTVEFLVDVERDAFYFLEMNARIQVEHPVTEMVTGVDLIAEQIAIASGVGLRLKQSDVTARGSAIEVRINAEDPAQDFRPSPGRVTAVTWPTGAGVRVDTHIESGLFIPPYYDSLLAKLIAQGDDRAAALARLQQALRSTHVAGVATNLSFHMQVLAHPEFIAGGVDTSFLARLLSDSVQQEVAHG